MTLYTTNCPKCKMLKRKLDELGLDYKLCDDIDLMGELGFMEAPMLEVSGEYLNFVDAVMALDKMKKEAEI